MGILLQDGQPCHRCDRCPHSDNCLPYVQVLCNSSILPPQCILMQYVLEGHSYYRQLHFDILLQSVQAACSCCTNHSLNHDGNPCGMVHHDTRYALCEFCDLEAGYGCFRSSSDFLQIQLLLLLCRITNTNYHHNHHHHHQNNSSLSMYSTFSIATWDHNSPIHLTNFKRHTFFGVHFKTI